MKIRALALAALLAAGPAAAQTKPALPANMAVRPADPENTMVIETNKGTIVAELYPDAAPITVARIKTLTRQHFYDGLEFFRVIEGFMDQTGDPRNDGQGGSSLPDIKGEFNFRRGAEVRLAPVATSTSNTAFLGLLPVTGQPDAMKALTIDGKADTSGLFCTGVLGMARAGEPDSANSQFFFMRSATPNLNGKYAAFGRVISGLDVVRAIKTGEPVQPPRDKMVRVRMLADIPEAERPKAMAVDTTSPAFKAYADSVRQKLGANYFDICDLDISTP